MQAGCGPCADRGPPLHPRHDWLSPSALARTCRGERRARRPPSRRGQGLRHLAARRSDGACPALHWKEGPRAG
jgi:hypothetical protein